MSDDRHDVHEVFINSAKFKLLIMHIPDDVIDDYLTIFTGHKGVITKKQFDNFLMKKCVANISEFVEYLNNKTINKKRKKTVNKVKISSIRKETVDAIMKYNPNLKPDNLVLNINNVVKRKKKGTKDDSLLMDNDFWNYEDEDLPVDKSTDKKGKDKIKKIKDLPYTPVKVFWNRLEIYLLIRKYSEEHAYVILKDKIFTSKSKYQNYIINVCIENVQELYVSIDRIGLSGMVDLNILVNELYEECKKVNPFLDYSFSDLDEDTDSDTPSDGFYQRFQSGKSDEAYARSMDVKSFRQLEKNKLISLSDEIKEYVIGQDSAIDSVVRSIQRASVGLKEPDQPIGAFVFAGYSGVGKTWSAKVLAEKLTGSKKNLITIDCSEFSADHEYAKLIGSPNGYVGFEQGGYLTNAVKKNPFCVVLFDEIEKASEKVHQLLLQVMEEGRLTDGKGQHVSFKDVVIVMTSNIGVKEMNEVEKTIGFGGASELTKIKREKAIKDALKKKFKPEFINRITSIVQFNALVKKDYLNIIGLEFKKIAQNLEDNNTSYSDITLVFDKSLHEFIYKEGIDEKMGARPLKRAIEHKISTPLAIKLLESETIDEFSVATLSSVKNVLSIIIDKSIVINSPPFYMQAGFLDA